MYGESEHLIQPHYLTPKPSRLAATAKGVLVVSFSVAQAPPPMDLPNALMVFDLHSSMFPSEDVPVESRANAINDRGFVVGS